MAIEEIVDVSVAGLGGLDDLAAAFDKAAESAGKLKGDLASLGGLGDAAAGAGKFADAWSAAADKVSESLGKIKADMAGLGSGAAGDAGAAKFAAAWSDAADKVSASMDKAAEGAGKLDDIGTGAAGAAGEVGKLGDALGAVADEGAGLGGAADGIKGIGTSSDEAAAQVAALRAEITSTIAETSALQDKIAAGSAESSLSLAKGDAAMVAAAPSLATSSVEQDAARAQASKQAAADASAAEASASKYHMLALGGAVALAYGVDKAAQLQTSVTRLYTTAGESQKNLPGDTAGILALSGQTNTSQAQLAQGAYMISSAGYHGQDMLGILKAAAQGAQAEGAPLSETGNALTSLMNAYGTPKGQSTSQAAMSDMNEIITMVGQGKMTMAGAVNALPAVLPVAAAAKMSFPQVAGSLATMTSMGMSPQWASNDLRHTIGALQNQNTVQTGEEQQLGLNPVSIEKNLGKTGLTGTLDEINTAVMKSMGPSGLVMLKTFNQSASAAQDATTMMKAMPPQIQKVAQSYLDGSISAKQYNAEVFSGSESAGQKNLLQQFATTANAAHGFNAALKSGQPDAQVYSAAMSKILGGTVGLQTALMLTGQHAGTAKSNVDAVASSAAHAGDNVKGWSAVQSTLNYQLGSFQKTTEAVATQAGQIALPAVTDVMKGLSDAGSFLASNPALTKALTIGGGILGAGYLAQKVASPVMTAVQGVGKIGQVLNIPGADKLANVGSGSSAAGANAASGGLDKVTGSADAAAAALDRVGAAGDKAATGESAAGAAGDKAAAGESAAGAAGDRAAIGEDAAGVGGVRAGAGESAAGLGAGKFGAAMAGLSFTNIAAIGVTLGLVIKALGDKLAPAGTQAGKYNRMLQTTPATNSSSLMPSIFGGFEGKVISSIGQPVGNDIARALGEIFGKSIGQMAGYQPPAKTAPVSANFTNMLGSAMGKPVKLPPPDLSGLDAAKAKVQADMSSIDHLISAGKAAKIPAPDMAALESAKGKAVSDLNAINRAIDSAVKKPAKMAAPDLGSLDAGKAKAMTAAQGIQTAAQQAVQKPVRPAAPDLSPYVAARGTAAADGAAIDAGLASGIQANAGAAVAAANSVAAQVGAAMARELQVHSPSKVTQKIGASAVDGLVVGLEGGQAAVTAAAQALGKQTAKAADVTAIDAAITKGIGDAGKDSALVKYLKADQSKLLTLSAQRTKLETEITDSQQIAQAAISNASILNAATATPFDPSTVQSSDGLISGMKIQAQQQQQFLATIGQLQKGGLNATSLNQLVQAGPSSEGTAKGLADGGKAAIAQVNKIESQIHASAAKLGDVGGPAMYQAGVDAAAGLAKGIDSQLGNVDAAITKMASSIVATIKKDLKISSPSLVGASLGAEFPAGVAMGIDRGAPMAASAAGRLGSSVAGGYRPPAAYAHAGGGSGGGGGGGGGGGDTHYHFAVTVQGSVTTENDLLSKLQTLQLKKANSNWQGGWSLPNRRT